MADLSNSACTIRDKKSKTRKKSAKIDMTAMVDVAFLLLSFFVLTATILPDHVMELSMPPSAEERLPVEENTVMTLILHPGDSLSYYIGQNSTEKEQTDYGPNGIRKAIRQHLTSTENLPLCEGRRKTTHCWDPIFVIKPTDEACYKNLIDILDELAICGAGKYAIAPLSSWDKI